jgi:hypothetical protein
MQIYINKLNLFSVSINDVCIKIPRRTPIIKIVHDICEKGEIDDDNRKVLYNLAYVGHFDDPESEQFKELAIMNVTNQWVQDEFKEYRSLERATKSPSKAGRKPSVLIEHKEDLAPDRKIFTPHLSSLHWTCQEFTC